MVKHPCSSTAIAPRAATAGDIPTERLGNTTVPSGHAYTFGRRGRYWEVLDPTGTLVCVTVYKRGAQEVIRRMTLGRHSAWSRPPLDADRA